MYGGEDGRADGGGLGIAVTPIVVVLAVVCRVRGDQRAVARPLMDSCLAYSSSSLAATVSTGGIVGSLGGVALNIVAPWSERREWKRRVVNVPQFYRGHTYISLTHREVGVRAATFVPPVVVVAAVIKDDGDGVTHTVS